MRRIAPDFEVPYALLNAKPVDARVDEIEIAPRHQFDTVRGAIGDVAHEPVRDDDHPFAGMACGDVGKARKRAVAKRRRALAARYRVLRVGS